MLVHGWLFMLVMINDSPLHYSITINNNHKFVWRHKTSTFTRSEHTERTPLPPPPTTTNEFWSTESSYKYPLPSFFRDVLHIFRQTLEVVSMCNVQSKHTTSINFLLDPRQISRRPAGRQRCDDQRNSCVHRTSPWGSWGLGNVSGHAPAPVSWGGASQEPQRWRVCSWLIHQWINNSELMEINGCCLNSSSNDYSML